MPDDAPPREIDIATDRGDVCINEDELPTVTGAERAWLRLTREELNRLFAMGMGLMWDKTVRDRVRPMAAETSDGHWEAAPSCPSGFFPSVSRDPIRGESPRPGDATETPSSGQDAGNVRARPSARS